MRKILPLVLLSFLCFPQPLKVGEGITDLLRTYPRWGYRIKGGEEKYMPPLWYGRYEETGADCYPQAKEGERTPWFLHPPWRNVTGITFMEYQLALPKIKPIALRIQVALSKGALPASDGVVFSLWVVQSRSSSLQSGDLLICRGQTKERKEKIWEEFCRTEEWQKAEVDLSAYEGKTVTLRLEVSPGEKWNTTNDWARLGELALIVGDPQKAKEVEEEKAREFTKWVLSKYGEETGRVGKWLGVGAKEPSPSSMKGYKNHILKRSDGSYEFQYVGRDCSLSYILRPPFSSPKNIQVKFNGKPLPSPTFLGGVSLFMKDVLCDASTPDLRIETKSKLAGDHLEVEETWRYRGQREQILLKISLKGKSLRLEYASPRPVLYSINIAVPPFSKIFVPFLYEGQAQVGYIQPVFLSAFCDWWRTESSTIGADGASPTYIPKTDGRRNPPREIFYLTVSPFFPEVLPNIPNPPSPFLAELSKRIVLDVWAGKFQDDENFLKELATYGVDSLLVLKHDWQREGYDNAYPTTMPANKELGGDEGLRSLCETAKNLGHRFCIHENYFDYYPNSEAFRKEDVALDPQGNALKGWFNPGVPIQAFLLKPSKFLHYEKIFSPEIKKRYGVNAGYFDIMPNWTVDYDAKAEGAGKISYTLRVNAQAFQFLRDTYGGPVVCEGSDFTCAGYYDGGSNYALNRRQIPLLGDFELLKVHPLMLNHGVGYYERWLIDGYSDPTWYYRVMTEEELDEYRIMTFAFGRIGFIGHQLMTYLPGLLKEYFLTKPVQERYALSLPSKILYEVDGKWVSSSGAVLLGKMDRLFLEYDNGLKLFLNRGKEDWKMEGVFLPQYGFLAKGAGVLAYTAKREGVICDYAEDEAGIFCDARTQTYLPLFKRIYPAISQFKDLGGGNFSLTYQWKIEDSLDGDFVSFVHFIDPQTRNIAFQQDHPLPLPTSQWHKGMVLEDGPHTIKVPEGKEGEFPIYIGLYNTKGERVVVGNGRDSVNIGKLIVKRDGEVKIEMLPQFCEDIREKYQSRLNKEGKVVDFGKVATDGCLYIKKEKNGLLIIPIPHGRECFVALKFDQFFKDWQEKRVSIIALNKEKEEVEELEAKIRKGILSFHTAPTAYYYRIKLVSPTK